MKKSKYLLDTNICIALLRGNKVVAQKIIEAGENNCCISIITLYELWFGAYNSMHEDKEIPKIKTIANHFPIISLLDSAEEYGYRKTKLRMTGIMIDEFDLLIAATALSGKYILVTDNLKHFRRIEDITIENWIAR